MATQEREDVGADRILCRTPVVTVGSFRARVDDPWFRDSGPIQRPIFVFPRTSVLIQHEGGRPFPADTCTVTYYNEGQRYTRRPLDPRGDRCEWFSVRPDIVRDALAEHDPGVRDREELFTATHGRSDAWSYGAQRMVVRHLEAAGESARASVDAGVEEAVLGVLARVLALLYGERAAASAGGDEVAERVRVYLVEHFTAPLSLDDIASATGVSLFHMCREFKRCTGTTVHRYRNQLRLRRSLERVADPASDLTRVALELGYCSHSHFTAAFRDAFSMTPSAFRKTATRQRVREIARRARAAIG